ncbi:hypothetical protein AMR41_26825 [Hapalosiphon sp. MRB220]|nr:hypothetical protein AMR41_26825 [Hapalosiphon sp. MRB220]
MKRKIILNSFIGLSILVTCLVISSQSGAEPASVFRPLIDDIRTQLPQGLKMRLPSSLPPAASNIKLYPYIASDSKIFEIRLANTPDCSTSNNPSACTAGGFGVFTPEGNSKIWPPKGDNITPVNLGNGISGFYITRGQGNNISQYVFWKQDGLEYVLGLGGGSTRDVSQQQMIDMAISMANEPAITSK